MKITFDTTGAEDLEAENFAKIRTKKLKLQGRPSVTQLMSRREEESDPSSKFTNPDLKILGRMGYLDELISPIRMGKEASVFLGRNNEGLVAVKVYTDLRVRSFRRDESYREGRFVRDSRLKRAIEQGSQKGLDAHQILWVQEELRQMQHLYEHGVSVPKAIAVSGISLVMEFIGDEHGNPAPRVSDLKMGREEAAEAFRQAVHNLKLIVGSGRVHGDYSAFNILWHDGKAIVIDFPQVIEFRNNRNALTFLERDVRSLCKSFVKKGVKADEARIFAEVRHMLRADPHHNR